MKSINSRPWGEWAERVIIHVPHYLSADGAPTSGGRQRKVRDLAEVIKDWGRDVVIVQKGRKDFETSDDHGNAVIGIRAPLRVLGDPIYAKRSVGLIRPGDAYLSVGQEDGYPFFVEHSKGMHTGVWWDGPHARWKQNFNARRVMSMISAYRSMWCVDTNIINWIRAQGKRGYALAKKCVYVPNCVDLSSLPVRKGGKHDPIRILFARRYVPARGGELFLQALSLLKDSEFNFEAILSSAQGQTSLEQVRAAVSKYGLDGVVSVVENDMDSVLELYQEVDLAVVPTMWSEGTSYACVEAIAAGVPAVVTPVGGLGNLVIPGVNGVVASPIPEAFASAIREASGDDAWESMRNNCLAMRSVFGKDVWVGKVRRWLQS